MVLPSPSSGFLSNSLGLNSLGYSYTYKCHINIDIRIWSYTLKKWCRIYFEMFTQKLLANNYKNMANNIELA